MSEVTGEQLWHALSVAAAAAGMSIQKFSRPLFNEPNWKLEQLRIAKRPSRATIARVRAHIAGEPLPPTRAGHYVRDERAFGLSRVQAEAAGIPPSRRSVREGSLLEQQLATRRRMELRRDLADAARLSRRPGQVLADRVRELTAEVTR